MVHVLDETLPDEGALLGGEVEFLPLLHVEEVIPIVGVAHHTVDALFAERVFVRFLAFFV